MVRWNKDLPSFNGKPCYPCYQGLFANTPPVWLGQHIEYPAGACSPQKWIAEGTPCEYPTEMVGLTKELPRFYGKPYYPCYWVLSTNTPPIWLGWHIEYPTGAWSPRKLVAKGIK